MTSEDKQTCPECKIGDVVEYAYKNEMYRGTEVARVAEVCEDGFRPEGYPAFKLYELMGVFKNYTTERADLKAKLQSAEEKIHPIEKLLAEAERLVADNDPHTAGHHIGQIVLNTWATAMRNREKGEG
jgi:hypothetical protein